MTPRHSRSSDQTHCFVAVLVLLALLIPVTGLVSLAQEATPPAEPPSIVGSWIITATVTSEEAASYSFVNFATYMPGGVLVTTAPDSPLGHGAWAPSGDGSYEITIVFPDFDDDEGALEGQVTVRATITLGADGTTFTAPFLTEVTDATGAVRYAYGGTAQAQRIQVEPLETPPAGTPGTATPAA
jgi:hypothetical protein